jgi:hypothetical protein
MKIHKNHPWLRLWSLPWPFDLQAATGVYQRGIVVARRIVSTARELIVAAAMTAGGFAPVGYLVLQARVS